ncbi:hypothetical protein [Borreliella turdi]|nr:hypothetical protein [Borreliella turdi]
MRLKAQVEKINVAIKTLISSGYAALEALKDNAKIGIDGVLLEKY